jgi:hypothetical protein
MNETLVLNTVGLIYEWNFSSKHSWTDIWMRL